MIASGGIGGNFELVRRNWPRTWGEPPSELISGVPDFVDGSMIEVTEQVGGRVINPDRMWHYPEGIVNHAPLWSHHGIRILPGPSSLWLDARGRRFPRTAVPRLRRPGRAAARHRQRVPVLLVRARHRDHGQGVRAVRLGAER